MKKSKSVILTVSISILASMVVLEFIIISLLMGTVLHNEQSRVWDTKLIYACYNNNIRPCDEPGIARWNNDHPDNAITQDYLQDPLF